MGDVGKKIRKLRLDNKYTKDEFAQLIGVSVRTIDRWEEKGKKKQIREVNLIKICTAFQISIRDFLEEEK